MPRFEGLGCCELEAVGRGKGGKRRSEGTEKGQRGRKIWKMKREGEGGE